MSTGSAIYHPFAMPSLPRVNYSEAKHIEIIGRCQDEPSRVRSARPLVDSCRGTTYTTAHNASTHCNIYIFRSCSTSRASRSQMAWMTPPGPRSVPCRSRDDDRDARSNFPHRKMPFHNEPKRCDRTTCPHRMDNPQPPPMARADRPERPPRPKLGEPGQ